jgi:lipopolysaccharide/colanic/teichoic acid biosynthesis glycosyltransferase
MHYTGVKRGIDVFMAIFLGLLFFPICLMVAIAIKLEDRKGGIFLTDAPPRVGKDGKLFYTYKFRSMIPGAHLLIRTDPKYREAYEQFKLNSYKLKEDPRVTRVGRFIRKYSLDEVPQFLNVLRGDMSLIGPRPYFADELEEQQKKFPMTKNLVKETLSVRPGITGLWQVSGRSDVNFDKRIEMDAYYARHHNLWYDLKILIKTPVVMLSGRGAS